MSRDGGYLGLFLPGLHWPRKPMQSLDGNLQATIETELDINACVYRKPYPLCSPPCYEAGSPCSLA